MGVNSDAEKFHCPSATLDGVAVLRVKIRATRHSGTTYVGPKLGEAPHPSPDYSVAVSAQQLRE